MGIYIKGDYLYTKIVVLYTGLKISICIVSKAYSDIAEYSYIKYIIYTI